MFSSLLRIAVFRVRKQTITFYFYFFYQAPGSESSENASVGGSGVPESQGEQVMGSEMLHQVMLPNQQFQQYHRAHDNGLAKPQPPKDAMFYQSHLNHKVSVTT